MSWHIHEVYSWWWWYILMSHFLWVFDTLLVCTWYMVGCTCLWYRLITGCFAQVGAWLMPLFTVQIDIYSGFLPHLSWCWEWKLILAYRSGSLVDLYSIQLLLKNTRLKSIIKTKIVHTSCLVCVPCGDDLLMICCWYVFTSNWL